MIRIVLPDDAKKRNLPFYLAMEEWVAKRLPADEYFFSWIVGPAVIIGRNQDLECEVDQEYCRAHGIDIYRRKSGGGCVYTDQNNIMLSYICPGADVQTAFARFSALIVNVLLEMDLNAARTERNDVLIGGRKVSGSAFYRLPATSIVHGTLLYDTDMEHMLHAITPDRSKLQSHKVQSVAQRITTIKEHNPYMNIQAFVSSLNFVLADEDKILLPHEVEEIEKIEQAYYNPDFINGVHSRSGKRTDVPRAGHFCPMVRTRDGIIESVELVGDFLAVEDLRKLLGRLVGVPCDRESILQALSTVEVADTILYLDNEALADIIANANT